MMHQQDRLRSIMGMLAMAMALGCVAVLQACSALGFGAHLVGGNPTTPASYVLEQRPLVVVVQDQPDPTGQKIESESIASQIDEQLTEHALAPVVSSVSVSELRATHPVEFASMSSVQIARAVGAQQVLDVKIIQSSVAPDGYTEMYHGTIAAMIRVFDAETGAVLWPTEQPVGASVVFGTPTMRASDTVNRTSIERVLCAGLARGIVKQFREYDAEE